MDTSDFRFIHEYFSKADLQFREEKGSSVFDTSHGIFGVSDLLDVIELFKNVELEKKAAFVDLGSGDGRIALLASLFTQSTGIEADAELHQIALAAKKELVRSLPQLSRCSLVNADYFEEDLSRFDVLFIYADHSWPEEFERKLLRECKGILYSHHNIFSPTLLKKGRTVWVGQTPFVSYPLGG